MISEYLNEKTVLTNQSITTWKECVRKGGEILVSEGYVEPRYIDSMIETIHTFGPYVIIVPQIALFHGKPGYGVNNSGLALVVLDEEIVFDDFDNQTIKCAFSFAAVDSESHLGMLQQLSVLLQDKEFYELITNNGGKEDILKKIRLIDKEKI